MWATNNIVSADMPFLSIVLWCSKPKRSTTISFMICFGTKMELHFGILSYVRIYSYIPYSAKRWRGKTLAIDRFRVLARKALANLNF